MIATVLLLSLSLGAQPKSVNCDEVCKKASESCANSCAQKRRQKDPNAKACDTQCETVVKKCAEMCKGGQNQKDAKKATELRKKYGMETKGTRGSGGPPPAPEGGEQP